MGAILHPSIGGVISPCWRAQYVCHAGFIFGISKARGAARQTEGVAVEKVVACLKAARLGDPAHRGNHLHR